MDVVNIADPEFTYDADDPEGFRSGMHRLGPIVGGAMVGASLYEHGPVAENSEIGAPGLPICALL